MTVVSQLLWFVFLPIWLCMCVCLCVCFLRVGGVFEGSAAGEKTHSLRRELSALEREEKILDELIQSSTNQLRELTEDKDNQRYPFSVLTNQQPTDWPFTAFTRVHVFCRYIWWHCHVVFPSTTLYSVQHRQPEWMTGVDVFVYPLTWPCAVNMNLQM